MRMCEKLDTIDEKREILWVKERTKEKRRKQTGKMREKGKNNQEKQGDEVRGGKDAEKCRKAQAQ